MASLSEQFQLLRVRIESLAATPKTILISSALASDGKNVCARGLAMELQIAGYSTLLVDLDLRDPAIMGGPKPDDLESVSQPDLIDRFVVREPSSGLSKMSLASDALAKAASRGKVAAFLSAARSTFDIVVVAAPTLLDSGIGLLFATECDGVLVTARKGRSVHRDDRALADVIEKEGLTLLGVVSVAANAEANLTSRWTSRQRSSSPAPSPIAVSLPRSKDTAVAHKLVL